MNTNEIIPIIKYFFAITKITIPFMIHLLQAHFKLVLRLTPGVSLLNINNNLRVIITYVGYISHLKCIFLPNFARSRFKGGTCCEAAIE